MTATQPQQPVHKLAADPARAAQWGEFRTQIAAATPERKALMLALQANRHRQQIIQTIAIDIAQTRYGVTKIAIRSR